MPLHAGRAEADKMGINLAFFFEKFPPDGVGGGREGPLNQRTIINGSTEGAPHRAVLMIACGGCPLARGQLSRRPAAGHVLSAIRWPPRRASCRHVTRLPLRLPI